MTFHNEYLNKVAAAVNAISRAEVEQASDLLYGAWQQQRTVFFIGNGGSAATASHAMNDFNKLTYCPGKNRFRAIALTDNMPLITAWGNDSSYEVVFTEPMRNLMREGDLLVAISTSGNSPNVVHAAAVAKSEFGATVIAWVGAQGGKLAPLADCVIHIPDPHIGVQEDGHMILNHCLANGLAARIREAG